MISYQNSSSQCMNFKRRGLVWKSVVILFSLYSKNHPVHEIQTLNLNWIFKKIIFNICVAGLTSKMTTGRENCSLISMILSNFPRNVNCCYCCYQLRQQRRLAMMTSKRSKWNKENESPSEKLYLTKTRIRLHIRAVWSDSSLFVRRKLASFAIQNKLSKDSDQNVRIHRLIWIFAGARV